MDCEKEEDQGMDCGEESGEESMEEAPMGEGWKHRGWGDWHMKKCGCPACLGIMAMKKMPMMGGMMSGMGMHHMGMGAESAPWRKFMSSGEKIEKLEAYLKDLQMEQKAVEEKIAHIRRKFQS